MNTSQQTRTLNAGISPQRNYLPNATVLLPVRRHVQLRYATPIFEGLGLPPKTRRHTLKSVKVMPKLLSIDD